MIVTAGTLMADRRREYCLGESIPENDLESLVAAIRRILSAAQERTHHKELEAAHDSYTGLNSREAVRDAMDWVLQSAGL